MFSVLVTEVSASILMLDDLQEAYQPYPSSSGIPLVEQGLVASNLTCGGTGWRSFGMSHAPAVVQACRLFVLTVRSGASGARRVCLHFCV